MLNIIPGADHDLLDREGEYQLAVEIKTSDAAVWAELLAYPPTTRHLAERIRSLIEDPPRMRRLIASADRARRKKTKGARQKLRDEAQNVAAELRPLDLDREIRRQLISELRDLAGSPTRDLGFRADCRGFADYLARVEAAERAAQRPRDAFMQSNLRLVISIAGRFAPSGLTREDLIQEGCIGLIKAVDRYDHERGFRFSTFATWWIRHAIGRAIADTSRTVRVPVHVCEAERKVAAAKKKLGLNGHEPDTSELAAATGLSKNQVANVQRALPEINISFDKPVGNENDSASLYDLFDDLLAVDPQPLRDLFAREARERVSRLLETLEPMHANILRRRFGLDGTEPETLAQIGRDYDLSRERIRQLQRDALHALRRVA